MTPDISIITVNKDNAEGLQATINSVTAQTYHNYEHIIIDGASTDDSLKIIESNNDLFSYWHSEADKGIYDAMNKGIVKSNGFFLLFLNSGDVFSSENSLQHFVPYLQDHSIIYSDIYLNKEGNLIPYNYPEKLTLEYLWKNAIPHQATLIKRSLFDTVGLYNEKNKIVSDWEWILKAFAFYNIKYFHLPENLVIYDLTGISFNKRSKVLINKEKEHSRKAIFSEMTFDFLNKSYQEFEFQNKINSNLLKRTIYKCLRKLLNI